MNGTEIFRIYNKLIESSDLERLKKIIARYELFKKTLKIPGDILECGVFKGTGHIFWLKLLKIYDHNSIKKVIGFDTFSGFPKTILNFEKKEANKYIKEAKYKNDSVASINKKIKEAGLQNNSELIKGDIVKTSKKYIQNHRGFRISLINLDLDTYEGTKHALKNFFPLVSKGGVVIFDEYGARGWGESEAVDEYFSNTKYKIQKTSNVRKPTAYLIKE